MNRVLRGLSETAVSAAIEENYLETWSNFGRFGGELYRDDEIVRVASRVPYIPYNGVIRTQFRGEDIDRKIAANVAYFNARSAQMLWAVTPSTRPVELPARLERHGFACIEELVGMAVDLDGLPDAAALSPDIEIREVTDLAGLRQYADMVSSKWNLPSDGGDLVFEFNKGFGVSATCPGRRWMAYLKGKPIAKAFLYLGKGAAGLYGVSTVPEARKKGVGRAITIAALLGARRAGQRLGVLHSTKMALDLYRALGFREFCRLQMYAIVDAAQSALAADAPQAARR